MNIISKKCSMLGDKNQELKDLIEKRAQAERNFQIHNAEKILELKTFGHPITIIRDLSKGDKVIAELKFKLDLADGILNACRESMKDIREQIGALRSFLTWLRAERENP